MSWGYFVEFTMGCPTPAWKTLLARPMTSQSLPAGWSSLQDASLEASFGCFSSSDVTWGEALGWPAYAGCHERQSGDERSSRRIVLLADKSQLNLVAPLASLLFAGREIDRAKGGLRIVNDGTYEGEDGVVLRLANGVIDATPIESCFEHVEELGQQLFGG